MPIVKVWRYDDKFTLEFKSNGSFNTSWNVNADSIKSTHGNYSIERDSILTLNTLENKSSETYFFKIKDSILFLVHHNKSESHEFDTTYYHLNPKYSQYHIEQLYKYGKIVDTNLSKNPLLNFQF